MAEILYNFSTMDIMAIFFLNALASFVISLSLLTVLIATDVIKWRLLHDALNFLVNPAKYEEAKRKRRNSIMQTHKQITMIAEREFNDNDVQLSKGDDDDDLPDYAKRDARVSRKIQFVGVRQGGNDLDRTTKAMKIEKWNI